MNPRLGRYLSIRSMVYVAGRPVPYFWPMRGFIHHNPLHGLEHIPFAEALHRGAELFHATTFLSRRQYQDYLANGDIDPSDLEAEIVKAMADRPAPEGIDQRALMLRLLTQTDNPVFEQAVACTIGDVAAALSGREHGDDDPLEISEEQTRLRAAFLQGMPVYMVVDSLFGTKIAEDLDERVIRACLEFFDEGQSAWSMPNRDKGFFHSWRGVASRKARQFLDSVEATHASDGNGLQPEHVIDHVLTLLGVDEAHWQTCFSREIARLHGWSGFIRWRSGAKRYYWSQTNPGDLVDLLAIRMTLSWLLLDKWCGGKLPRNVPQLRQAIDTRGHEMSLRREFHAGRVLPEQVSRVERVLAMGRASPIEQAYADHWSRRKADDRQRIAARIRDLASRSGQQAQLPTLSESALTTLLENLRALEAREGMVWLRALESGAMKRLMTQVSYRPPRREKPRPFAQAAFCIDTRSERIRRHLESVGDYETYGIAGFFGVPMSLIELGKGSEKHLCPVLLTPKNLVLEMSADAERRQNALGTLEHVVHELKETILAPFVTVEAIGLVFGLDMIGKTVSPQVYNRLRKRLHDTPVTSRLMLDKLDRHQADSIVRAAQRAIILEALAFELKLEPTDIQDSLVRSLREAAMGNVRADPDMARRLGLDAQGLEALIDKLRTNYRVNRNFAHLQMEELGRVGFSLEEQLGFVQVALTSIGLTENFSRFVLLTGHGSTSENNPYESALDCGACGGNDGTANARALAQIANRQTVRRALRDRGIDIPDDTWFVPALHDTVTDDISLLDLDLMPPGHLVYLDRLRAGLAAASQLCAQERLPTLMMEGIDRPRPSRAFKGTSRNAVDWSQVRPEWGLSGNAYFIIGRRALTREAKLDGRAFLHSYDYRMDPKRKLLENILTGPLVVGQWINLEHYFSAVDNDSFGSGSKVYHNVAGRIGVMTGNLSDLRTGLPSQTVLNMGEPYHQPLRLITVIEAPLGMARAAIRAVVAVKQLVTNGWIRMIVVDPETGLRHLYDDTGWVDIPAPEPKKEERIAS